MSHSRGYFRYFVKFKFWYFMDFQHSEVTERTADWAGVMQDLKLNSFNEEPLQFWFNFSIQVNQMVRMSFIILEFSFGYLQATASFKLRVENEGQTKYISLFHQNITNQDWNNFHQLGKKIYRQGCNLKRQLT